MMLVLGIPQQTQTFFFIQFLYLKRHVQSSCFSEHRKKQAGRQQGPTRAHIQTFSKKPFAPVLSFLSVSRPWTHFTVPFAFLLIFMGFFPLLHAHVWLYNSWLNPFLPVSFTSTLYYQPVGDTILFNFVTLVQYFGRWIVLFQFSINRVILLLPHAKPI